MLHPLLQLTFLFAVSVYLGTQVVSHRRHNSKSWESLLSELRLDWSGSELTDKFLWKEELALSTDEAWQRLRGVRGLWVMHQNARVMLRMADFAERNCPKIDPMLLATLRADALQIRISVLTAMVQYACTKTSEGVRVHALRAAQSYTAMSARMTRLLQENAAICLPDFIEAM